MFTEFVKGNKTREKEISRLLEHVGYSSTGNPVDLP